VCVQSIAYMLSANMDSGSTEYQVEAAISKVYGSVCCVLLLLGLFRVSLLHAQKLSIGLTVNFNS